jgi:hypothetical protein
VANFSLIVVPFLGALANSITAIALTEFLAKWLDEFLSHPEQPPPEVTMEGLKTLFVNAFKNLVPRRGASPDAVPPAPAGEGKP